MNVTMIFLYPGLKINNRKSKLLGIGVSMGAISEMVDILECGISILVLPSRDVLVGCNMPHIANWKDVAEKLKKKHLGFESLISFV